MPINASACGVGIAKLPSNMAPFKTHFVTRARRTGAAALIAALPLLTACEPLSITALGVGGSAAVNHKANATGYRTFTASLPKVRTASIGALKRMGMTTDGLKKVDNGELITARAGKREIEVELESITANTTRMRVVARDGGFFYDGSTAAEIIVQTQKGLGV
jgi:hypothetical protein